MAWWFGSEARAARRYGAELTPWLAKSFGASEFYTPAQIRAGIRALKLNPRHSDLAFAAFLPETAYAALAADEPSALPYHEAREKLLRWKPIVEAKWNPLDVSSNGG